MKFRNETERRECREKLKWGAVVVAFLLLAVAVAAACTQGFKDGDPYNWFGTKDDQAEVADNLIVSPAEEQGVSLAMRTIARDEYDDYGISPMALSAQIVTATVKDGLDNTPEELQKVTFEMAWKSTNSATVTDFVTMVTTDNTATFTCLKAFGTQIVVTVKSVFDETKTASITLDYVKGFSAYNMLAATKNYGEDASGASKSCAVTEGAVITAHFANVETRNNVSPVAGSWTQIPFAFPLTATWGTGTVENKLTKINVKLNYGSSFGPHHGAASGPTGWTAEITSSNADGTALKHTDIRSMSSSDKSNPDGGARWTQWGILAGISGYTSQISDLIAVFGASVDGACQNYTRAVQYLKDLDTATKPIEGTLTLTFQYGAAKTIKFYIDAEVEASSVKSLEVDHSGLLFYQ